MFEDFMLNIICSRIVYMYVCVCLAQCTTGVTLLQAVCKDLYVDYCATERVRGSLTVQG